MALDIKIGIINNDDSIIINDNTGDYNAINNVGGWGSPNSVHATPTPVSAISLDIYLPGTTVSIGAANLLGTTFFTSTDRAYNLYTDPSSVVPSFQLQDGVWKYVTSFTISSVSTTITTYSLRTNNLDCSIAKLALGDMDTNSYYEVKLAYDKMIQAFKCGEYNLSQDLYSEIIDMLTDCSPFSINSCGC